eukprot:scaffold13816_cov23-Cyclotella_meneghiniana.AAC.3
MKFDSTDEDDEDFMNMYPLHMACLNEHCPNSVVKLLMNKDFLNEVIGRYCSAEYNWIDGCERITEMGLPLHLYLSRKENLDIEIVQDMVEQYPDSLLIIGKDDINVRSNPIHVAFRNPNIDSMIDVVKYLVHSEPSSLLTEDNKGRLPLHLACENAFTTVEIVKYLVDSQPAAASQYDCSNHLPLSLLCFTKNDMPEETSIAILNILLEAYPTELSDAYGRYNHTIHDLFANPKRPFEFCKIMIDANPGSVTQVEEYGDLPFHYACFGGHLSTVKYLYELYPESIGIIGYEDRYPLHCACNNKDPEVLKFVYELYPEAIKLKAQGNLPIHEAIMAHDTLDEHKLEKLQFITHCYPGCGSKPNDDRSLPLHLACDNPSFVVIKYLYDLYPEAILERDGRGRLPIVVMREYPYYQSSTEDIIAFLGTQQNYARIARNPELVTTPDNGRLTLHHALHNNSPVGSVHLLVEGSPDTIYVADDNGLLPLQIACESCAVSVVKYLTNHIEDTFSLRDGNGNYLLHYACRGGNLEVVRYLLESGHTRAVNEKNKDNMLPVHLFNVFVKERWCAGKDMKYVETIWHLLLADPETLQRSNWIKNKDTVSNQLD